MNDNPYANDNAGLEGYAEPERTSGLAVVSLVLSLLCCIPGLGLLGAGVGVGALLGISGSRGRVGGRGVAIAGIILGILMSVAWVSFAVMLQGFTREVVREVYSPVNDLMVEIDAGNYDSARNALGSSVLAGVTDDELAAFRDAYQAELGSFVGIPTEPLALVQAYMQVGPQMQNIQPPQNGQAPMIPIPVEFDQAGMVVMLALVDEQNNQPQSPLDLFKEIVILMPDGSELELIGGGALPSGETVDADTDAIDDSSDAPSDEPADDDGP